MCCGGVGNQRVLLDYEAVGLKDQMPDGMTTDVDGNLWVACFAGNQVGGTVLCGKSEIYSTNFFII